MTAEPGRSQSDVVRVERIVVGGDPETWASLGLTLAHDGSVPFLHTSLRIDPDAPVGSMSWELSGVDDSLVRDGRVDVDGLPTVVVPAGTPMIAEHRNGAVELDHVVVLTSSLERTCAAVDLATGAPLKRVREVGSMRQGFHRVGRGGLIVEVVERPEVTDDHATFWGVVVNVVDLDAAVDVIGPDRVGRPKDAVQPGRRIATVRSEAGLGLPVALMSPA